MFRWDCGWAVGDVKNFIRRGQYNYFVRYVEDDGSIDEYRHTLTAHNYYNIVEETTNGVWFVIEQDADSDEW